MGLKMFIVAVTEGCIWEDMRRRRRRYPLLGQLARALVFAVAEEFDDAAFVGGDAEMVRERERKR